MTAAKKVFFDKEFYVENVKEFKEFSRPDGSTGSVQRIDNQEGEHSVTFWDHAPLEDLEQGSKYHVTNVREKEQTYEGKTFSEWHTCKNSVFTKLVTSMDREIHYEKKADEMLEPAPGRKDNLRRFPTGLATKDIPEVLTKILDNQQLILRRIQLLQESI